MAYKFETIKVLIAEDNQPMQDLLRSVLMTFGVGTILLTNNGDSAFERYRNENPDLIITDWMMQPGDGITLAKRIRNDRLGPNPYVPIILMTGFSEKKRVIHARDSGITEILAKPFIVRDLYKRIHEIIENPRQFVRSEDFFGPDRRRTINRGYMGPQRRGADRPKG